VARVEVLEDRTLLATLQFAASLGEQSTLDSVTVQVTIGAGVVAADGASSSAASTWIVK
jgi:hypothetical protein